MSNSYFVNNEYLGILFASLIAFAFVILLIRLNGLRSLSKMSSFDFTITVATSTIVASIATRSISITTGLISMTSLFAIQTLIAYARKKYGFAKVVDNTPLVLYKDNNFEETNLENAKITKDDIAAKLREANVLEMKDVRAIVLESTGDISVLHGSKAVDSEIMSGVRE